MLHDIDKSFGRLNPRPNSHDTLQGLQEAHGTESIHFSNTALPTKLSGSTAGSVAVISQTLDDGTSFTVSTDNGSERGATNFYVAQTFQVSSATAVSSAELKVTTAAAGTLTVALYQMLGAFPLPSSDTQVAVGSLSLGVITDKIATQVSFTTSPTLQPNATYYLLASWLAADGSTSSANVFASQGNPYPGGQLYTVTFSGVYANTSYPNDDAYFVIYSQATVSSARSNLALQPVAYGTAFVVDAAGTNWVTVPHNLGYTPTITAFLTNQQSSTGTTTFTTSANISLPTFVPNLTYTGGNAVFGGVAFAAVDSTNAYLFVVDAGAGSAPLGYHILFYLYRQQS